VDELVKKYVRFEMMLWAKLRERSIRDLKI